MLVLAKLQRALRGKGETDARITPPNWLIQRTLTCWSSRFLGDKNGWSISAELRMQSAGRLWKLFKHWPYPNKLLYLVYKPTEA